MWQPPIYMYIQNPLKYTPPRVDYYKFKVLPCEQALRGELAVGRELSCKISTNQCKVETSTNVHVMVNFLSQVIVFGYGNKFETKEKQNLPEIEN